MVNKRKKQDKQIQRVGVECIFRATCRSRKFTTPANFEAFNMLMNKLDQRGVKDQKGKLVFEFKATPK